MFWNGVGKTSFSPTGNCYDPPALFEDGGGFTPVDLDSGDFDVTPGQGSAFQQ